MNNDRNLTVTARTVRTDSDPVMDRCGACGGAVDPRFNTWKDAHNDCLPFANHAAINL